MAAYAAVARREHRRRKRRPKPTCAEEAAKATARHRLDVFGSSVTEVVPVAGAWLADRALDGWQVSVFVPSGQDLLPLRILGVTTGSLDGPLPVTGSGPGVTEVAVSANLLSGDERVYVRVLAEFTMGSSGVTLLGHDAVCEEFSAGFHPVTRVPSLAGHAFKRHARDSHTDHEGRRRSRGGVPGSAT